jgi:tetratricopeptide (TPR) repeat protein
MNQNLNAVDESLSKILSVQSFKDCYEALTLLARVKTLQGKRYEALVLYKKVIELNPNDYRACFNIAQMFDQKDTQIALYYYQYGIQIQSRLTEQGHQISIQPEILNNFGILRLE